MASGEISKVYRQHLADGRRIWNLSKQQTHSRPVTYILQTYVIFLACPNGRAV